LLAPGGQAQVLPPLPLPTATPSPTALPGPSVPSPQSPLACTPGASVPNSPPSCPVEPRASAPAPVCSPLSLRPGEARQIADLTPSPSWWYGASLAVDRNNPCHLFTTGRTVHGGIADGFPMTVHRGDVTASGVDWNTVFTMPAEPEQAGHDAQTFGGNTVPDSASTWQSAPVVGPDGAVWLAGTTPERGGAVHLTRVFRSGDTGSHWTETDNGIVAQDPT